MRLQEETNYLKEITALEKLLTSGTNGGSTIPASSLFQLIQLKNWCSFTSLAPYRPFLHPKRDFTVFDNSCWHNDLASSLYL